MEKQKQRLVSLILALVMCVVMLPVATSTVAATEYSGTCGADGDNLTWTLEDGVLTISGTGEMDDYATDHVDYYDDDGNIVTIYRDAPWYDLHDTIVSIVIENGVTSIGVSAFIGCKNLSSVIIPDSITFIREYAFEGCTSLTSLSMPDSVTRIGEGAFYHCTSLKSITIGNGVTSIGKYAFDDCESLTSITMGDCVTWIGDCAFYYCISLTSITIPDSVRGISYYAFEECTSLNAIIFEGDAPAIANSSFYDVTATAYYPAGNSTWTEDVMRDYGGNITWVAYDPDDIIFIDVGSDQYFYDAVQWAVENGVTTGTDTGVFSPFVECERCQIVTFLWRAAGSPTVEGVENPFTDVNEDDYFYMAVLWAVKEGITAGTTDTTFSPYAKCERCQVITFIWRYAGKPETSSTTTKFTDVNTAEYYATAVAWAVENGITTGTSSTEFGVTTTCERCMVVTFLYRYMG